MKALLAGLVLFVGLTSTLLTASAADAGQADALQAARTEAEHWLKLVDDGKQSDAWASAAPDFQKAVSKRKWQASLREMRGPLGKLASRKFKTADFTRDLPGAPEGDYVIVQFDSAFANKPSVAETVTVFRGEDLKWHVSAYKIK